jgi:hypothetical protein
VGSVGVKLVAAPDAPLRGQVLARALTGHQCGGRGSAAFTDTYLLRGFCERPVLAKGLNQRTTCRAVRQMPQCAGSGYSETTGLPLRRGLESGTCRGQHATAGIGRPQLRQGPHPGKDP